MSLNTILKSNSLSYDIPATRGEAFARAGTLAVISAASYVVSAEESGISIIDDYIFPTVKAALIGLTAASTVLAFDFYFNHHSE